MGASIFFGFPVTSMDYPKGLSRKFSELAFLNNFLQIGLEITSFFFEKLVVFLKGC